jgi:Mg/Co/Ni transporter MgtE
METPALDNVLDRIRAALKQDDLALATEIIQALRPPDQADVFADLDDAEQITLLPLLAVWLRIDPTVVSGPVMSTLVDASGLFIYFTIAGGILGLQ